MQPSSDREATSGALDLDEHTFEELLEIVALGHDEPVERVWDAQVLDGSEDIASSKVILTSFDINLHNARFADRWMIANILYRARDDP